MGDDGFVGRVIPSDEQNESQLRPTVNNYFQLFPTNRFFPLGPKQPLLQITQPSVELCGGVLLPALAAQLDGSGQLFFCGARPQQWRTDRGPGRLFPPHSCDALVDLVNADLGIVGEIGQQVGGAA